MNQMNPFQELIIDNFAGGGGASTGIELATGRSVDIAINHDPDAIAMHKTNHPSTKHYCESVWDVNPREAVNGQPVALVWLSPDCKHFSKAKGSKPVEKKIRGLAWIALKWAATVKPRVIMLENVEEFKTWGPLHGKHTNGCSGNHPRKMFKSHGEPIKWIDGKDTGCLTSCKKGQPIKNQAGKIFSSFKHQLRLQGYKVEHKELRACDFGAPTIRKRLFLIARRDGQPITWPKPTHYDPNKKLKRGEKIAGRKPWRTAAEIIDFSLDCPSIFERKRPLAENTLKRIAKGIERYVVDSNEPFVIKTAYKKANGYYVNSINEPFRTITAQQEGLGIVKASITPFITECANGSSQRNMAANEPLRTQCAQVKGGHFALVSAFLAKHYTGVVGADIAQPCPTVTSIDHNALVTSNLIKLRNGCVGQPVTEPVHTLTAGGGHIGEVRAFLLKYYGAGLGQTVNDPLHTVTTKDRYGLITVKGEQYQIVDIGMRMLQPHELYAAQGFPDDYIIDHDYTGKKITKTSQVARCGNAVPPPFAEHLVKANLPELCLGGEFYEANSKRAVGL